MNEYYIYVSMCREEEYTFIGIFGPFEKEESIRKAKRINSKPNRRASVFDFETGTDVYNQHMILA